MKGTFFDDLQIDLPDECVGLGGCWQRDPDGTVRAWDAPALKHFYELLKSVEFPVFMDIGANTGSVALLAHHIPDARCTAFEPNPAAFMALRMAVALNRPMNLAGGGSVCCVNAALGQSDGTVDLFVPVNGQTGMARIGHGTGLGATNVLQVHQYSLDSYLATFGRPETTRIDFISLDVEGRELDVLLGASKTLTMLHPGIQIEWIEEHAQHCGHTLTEVHNLLTLLGYNNHKTLSWFDRYYWKS